MQILIKAATAAQKRINRALVQKFGITYPQFEVLELLMTGTCDTLGEIADLAQCSRGNLTGIADRLERDGWIERERSREDRRVVNCRLTEAARNRMPQVLETVRSLNADVPAHVADYLAGVIQSFEGSASA